MVRSHPGISLSSQVTWGRGGGAVGAGTVYAATSPVLSLLLCKVEVVIATSQGFTGSGEMHWAQRLILGVWSAQPLSLPSPLPLLKGK